MKTVYVLFCTLFTLAANASDCLDVRAVNFNACPASQERVFVKGLCQAKYEVESSYCSYARGNPDCLDLRLANFTACDGEKERIYVRGKCFGKYLIEHSYCASR